MGHGTNLDSLGVAWGSKVLGTLGMTGRVCAVGELGMGCAEIVADEVVCASAVSVHAAETQSQLYNELVSSILPACDQLKCQMQDARLSLAEKVCIACLKCGNICSLKKTSPPRLTPHILVKKETLLRNPEPFPSSFLVA
jgi:hypothetical protein